MPLTDKFGRPITDLRISVTDRCNYKCVYCRTGNEGALYGDLPFADYLRMARVLAELGIQKVRITGGEPLLRRGVIDFVRQLARLRMPTLILWGGKDKLTPLEFGRWFARDIAGSRLVVFDDLGHVPQEEDPQRTAQEVKKFLGA